jgi:hypothetical protein
VERQCHIALEIKGGLYLDEYQPLIDLAEQKNCRVFPLENTLFRRDILALCNMVNAGVFGEIIYMRGGYRHDLRSLLLDDSGNIGLCLVGVVIGEFIGAREGLGYLIIYGSQVFRYAHAREGRMTDDWNRMSGRTKRNAVWRTTRFAGPRGNGKNLRTV